MWCKLLNIIKCGIVHEPSRSSGDRSVWPPERMEGNDSTCALVGVALPSSISIFLFTYLPLVHGIDTAGRVVEIGRDRACCIVTVRKLFVYLAQA